MKIGLVHIRWNCMPVKIDPILPQQSTPLHPCIRVFHFHVIYEHVVHTGTFYEYFSAHLYVTIHKSIIQNLPSFLHNLKGTLDILPDTFHVQRKVSLLQSSQLTGIWTGRLRPTKITIVTNQIHTSIPTDTTSFVPISPSHLAYPAKSNKPNIVISFYDLLVVHHSKVGSLDSKDAPVVISYTLNPSVV